MIVPTKGVHPRRALLTVGAQLLEIVGTEQVTVSQAWARLQAHRDGVGDPPIAFDWFVLALDLTHAVGAVQLSDAGLLERRS